MCCSSPLGCSLCVAIAEDPGWVFGKQSKGKAGALGSLVGAQEWWKDPESEQGMFVWVVKDGQRRWFGLLWHCGFESPKGERDFHHYHEGSN